MHWCSSLPANSPHKVEESVREYGKYLSLKSMTMIGGVNINPQIQTTAWTCGYSGCDTGGLLDHLQQKTVDLSHVEILGVGRSRPHAGYGLHSRHQKNPRSSCQEASEPAVLCHLLRRDQGAGRLAWFTNPALIEVARRNTNCRADRATCLSGGSRTQARTTHANSSRTTTGSKYWCSPVPNTARIIWRSI